MSSPEDLADTPELDLEDLTPPSSLSTSIKSSQGSRVEPDLTPFLNPTPEAELNQESLAESEKHFSKIKVEFFNQSGDRIHARYSSDVDVIDIVSSLLRSSDPDHRKSAVNKLLKSNQFGENVVDSAITSLHQHSPISCHLKSVPSGKKSSLIRCWKILIWTVFLRSVN